MCESWQVQICKTADTELKVDANPVGFGAILLQRRANDVRPVVYVSHINRRRWALLSDR